MTSQPETKGFLKELPKLFDKQIYKDISLAFILFSLIISALLVNYGIKMSNQEYCTADFLVDERTSSTLLSSQILNDTNSSLLQKFTWNNNDFEYSQDYYFCYSGLTQTSKTLNIEIINQDKDLLAKDYLVNGSFNNRCLLLDNNMVNNGDYIGANCNNCDLSNNVSFDQKLLGEEQELLYGDINDLNYESGKSLFDIRYTISCRSLFKQMINIYFSVAGIFFFLLIVFIGINWLKEALTKGWDF